MHHKHDSAIPQAQRLQSQFAVSITHILARDGEALNTASLPKKSKPCFSILAWRLASSYVTISKL
jgi:hypothetical protein